MVDIPSTFEINQRIARSKAKADHANGDGSDHHAPSLVGDDPDANDPPDWPQPLTLAALPGLVGEFIATLREHTEADDAALLFQFLAAFGSAVGKRPFYPVESSRHHANLFVLLVGETSKGRKGTSWHRIRELFTRAASSWATDRIATGLSSGEGLIHAVRDSVTEDGKIIDPGVQDKRLLVVSSEFAGVLRVMMRTGNTLSQVIRDAWDGDKLRTLTRNNAMIATDAHISQIGHTTVDELRRYLDATEAANGFANRYLLCCVRRARLLPDGGAEIDWNDFADRLHEVIDHASEAGLLEKDARARELWCDVYPKLSDARAGMLGAVTARAEAQTMRLALLFALLDRSDMIRRSHLEAALAVWRYADQSARFIFADATGDPIADTILAALRQEPEGLTQTEVSNLFAGNVVARRLTSALSILVRAGKISPQRRPSERGRPVTRWVSTDAVYINQRTN